MSAKKEMQRRQIDRLKTGDIGDINLFIKDNTRQVRWLYNNSNKCTEVIGEKKVRMIEAKLYRLDQQNKVELIPCECGHNVPEQFAYGTADSGYTCADCMITYKSEENKELKKYKEIAEKFGIFVTNQKDIDSEIVEFVDRNFFDLL